MVSAYQIADFDGDDDADERKTKERRLFMYSEVALMNAESAERVHVMFPEFRRGLDAFEVADCVEQCGQAVVGG